MTTTANHSNQISTGVHKNEHEDLEAYGEWVVVTRKLAPETHKLGTTEDGREIHLELPATVRDKMEAEYVGTVTSVGPDLIAKGTKLQVGDRVVYGRCFPMAKQGTKTEIFSLVHTSSIMAWVRNPDLKPGMAPVHDGLRQS